MMAWPFEGQIIVEMRCCILALSLRLFLAWVIIWLWEGCCLRVGSSGWRRNVSKHTIYKHRAGKTALWVKVHTDQAGAPDLHPQEKSDSFKSSWHTGLLVYRHTWTNKCNFSKQNKKKGRQVWGHSSVMGHTCLSCTKHLTGSQNVKKIVMLKNIPSRFTYSFGGWSHGESPGEGIVPAACIYDLSHIRTKPGVAFYPTSLGQ